MMCFNLRPGDRIQVGGVVVAFLGKDAGRPRFEMECSHRGRWRQSPSLAGRVDVLGMGGQASFVVEKRSGRSTRIALKADASVTVTRLSAMVPA